MAAATERVRRKTDRELSEKRRRWSQAAKSREQGVDEKPAEALPAVRKNVLSGAGQETLVIVTKDIVASHSEVDAIAQFPYIRSVQRNGNVGS